MTNLPDLKRTVIFWQKAISAEGCLLWSGAKNNRGYGLVRFKMKLHLVHRLVYQLYYTDLQPKDIVMHICDTPLCFNPFHLSKGTQSDNMQDWWNKRLLN